MSSIKVLVLNQSFEPLHFCNIRRAIVLVWLKKAEKIEYDGKVFRSPSFSMRVPIVIRLMRYVKKPYRKLLPFSKKNVFKRDDYTCQYCGKNHSKLTIDHIIPRSRGGATNWENVVVACLRCNLVKGDRPLNEVDLTLLRKPKRPIYKIYHSLQTPLPGRYQKVWDRYLSYKSH